jgi:hypothetical protein
VSAAALLLSAGIVIPQQMAFTVLILVQGVSAFKVRLARGELTAGITRVRVVDAFARLHGPFQRTYSCRLGQNYVDQMAYLQLRP